MKITSASSTVFFSVDSNVWPLTQEFSCLRIVLFCIVGITFSCTLFKTLWYETTMPCFVAPLLLCYVLRVCTLSRWFSILFDAVISGINHLGLINVSGPHGLKLKIPVKSRSLFKVIAVGLWFYLGKSCCIISCCAVIHKQLKQVT